MHVFPFLQGALKEDYDSVSFLKRDAKSSQKSSPSQNFVPASRWPRWGSIMASFILIGALGKYKGSSLIMIFHDMNVIPPMEP
jgi:hypothetical protein